MACCFKRVCNVCMLAVQNKGMFDCPFCRTPRHEDDTSCLAMVQKRVDAKDPAAMTFLGERYYFGRSGLEKNVPRAIELWTEAADLGSIESHFNLGTQYYYGGEGVTQDKAKAVRYYELAAMQGHVEARHHLGNHECRNGNYERAIRHYLIAAKMGDGDSLEMIKKIFLGGDATKEQYADALKGYQDAIEEMKSP